MNTNLVYYLFKYFLNILLHLIPDYFMQKGKWIYYNKKTQSYAKIKSKQEIHLYEIFHCNLGSLITFYKLQLHYSLFPQGWKERTYFWQNK